MKRLGRVAVAEAEFEKAIKVIEMVGSEKPFQDPKERQRRESLWRILKSYERDARQPRHA